MRTMLNTIVAIIALTVPVLGHADPLISDQEVPVVIDQRELLCLANNIFHEAANEPEEGKVAVGLVTINRSQDDRFPDSICAVVNQRTVLTVPRTQTITTTQEVKTGWFTRTTQIVTKQITILARVVVCQFSWQCQSVKKPQGDDERWQESVSVAQELLSGGYEELRIKYNDALYFHSVSIRPKWANQKKRINRIGGHIFYA